MCFSVFTFYRYTSTPLPVQGCTPYIVLQTTITFLAQAVGVDLLPGLQISALSNISSMLQLARGPAHNRSMKPFIHLFIYSVTKHLLHLLSGRQGYWYSRHGRDPKGQNPKPLWQSPSSGGGGRHNWKRKDNNRGTVPLGRWHRLWRKLKQGRLRKGQGQEDVCTFKHCGQERSPWNGEIWAQI